MKTGQSDSASDRASADEPMPSKSTSCALALGHDVGRKDASGSPFRASLTRRVAELLVGDKLEQASVRVSEVDMAPAASCTRVTVERASNDLDAAAT